MALAIIPFVLMVAGALLYALAGSAKLAELGRLTFLAGALALAFALAHVTMRIG